MWVGVAGEPLGYLEGRHARERPAHLVRPAGRGAGAGELRARLAGWPKGNRCVPREEVSGLQSAFSPFLRKSK